MKEKDFLRAVVHRARAHGWKTAHFGSTVKVVKRTNGYATIPDKGAAGFPDLVLARGERLVFAELKAGKGKVEEAQYDWLRALQATGAETHIWREHMDWPGNVEKILR
jgi:hypothetical protein